ncbi:T6SS immunity protein Tli4 family protein [Pseudomonas sp. Irchel 3E20]|uniref:T6SS immunity protein Tli4 family protein n=1 Tax=Pseudomonas sp. Irchel 3E20 TaxID=2008983 RepID=UPI000BA38EA4|nr:T6SS immunity protein Tli4 family protein [Pseudomonas sp. Irchel 3E20]
MNFITRSSLFILLNVCTSLAYAQKINVPEQWKTECIGNFQISVPGDVELALLHYHDRDKKYNFRTKMLQRVFYATTTYGGGIGVYYEDEKEFYLKTRQAEVDRLEKYRSDNKGNPKAGKFSYSFPDETSFLAKHGNSDRMKIEASSYYSGRRYTYETLDRRDEVSVTKDYDNFAKNFRPRALYEIPNEKGVCIPYGFIKSDTPQDRVISSAMRLKDHPDVTVLLMDKSASRGGFVRKENPTAIEEIRYIWEWGFNWRTEKLQATGFPRFPLVRIAGYKGRSSFVEITRPNPATYDPDDVCTKNSYYAEEQILAKCPPLPVDYGYVAYVQGDPNAKEDTPSLLLYVLQESKYGPDGKPSIGRDELHTMADTIAASIKRR